MKRAVPRGRSGDRLSLPTPDASTLRRVDQPTLRWRDPCSVPIRQSAPLQHRRRRLPKYVPLPCGDQIGAVDRHGRGVGEDQNEAFPRTANLPASAWTPRSTPSCVSWVLAGSSNDVPRMCIPGVTRTVPNRIVRTSASAEMLVTILHCSGRIEPYARYPLPSSPKLPATLVPASSTPPESVLYAR